MSDLLAIPPSTILCTLSSLHPVHSHHPSNLNNIRQIVRHFILWKKASYHEIACTCSLYTAG